MAKKFTHTKPNPRRADDFLPEIGRPWPRIARELHREIWFFGVHGCYESNATLARNLGCNRDSIVVARQLLVRHQAIIIARTAPRTWSMWSAYHPAVKRVPVLYFKGGYVDNPVYEISAAPPAAPAAPLEPVAPV